MRRTGLLAALVAIALVIGVVGALVATGVVLAPWSGRGGPRPSAVAGTPATAPTQAPQTRLAVAGDVGTGQDAEVATARAMAAQAGPTPYDGLLLLGDMVYPDGDPALVPQRVTGPFAPVLDAGTEMLPVLGNHDVERGQGDQIMSELGRDTRWYSEQIGCVEVIVLDSTSVEDPEQARWLEQQLRRPRPAGTWTVAAMHHPAYSAGQHGSDDAVREAWAPLFARYDVPLVLAGHDHDYQRSTPQQGVTYVVSGGGAKLRPTGHEAFTAVSTSELHYLDVLADSQHLTVRAVTPDGDLLDSFTLQH